MLGRTHNCREQFLAGIVTLFYFFLPVKLAVFESFIDDVCSSFVCGNSCCFRLKFHLCFCWGCDPSRYHHAAASPFFSPNKSLLVYVRIWLGQESYPERALLCSALLQGRQALWQRCQAQHPVLSASCCVRSEAEKEPILLTYINI